MKCITERKLFFKKTNYWFADVPFDVANCDAAFFYATKKDVTIKNFHKKESATLVIDLTKGLDAIWAGMKRTCRQGIKRGQREGIKVEQNKHHREFLLLYQKFSKSKNFSGFSDHIKNYMSHSTLFTASLNEELLAGMLIIEDERHLRCLIGGSKRLEANEETRVLIGAANRLIIWETIQYAHRKGLVEFDFGGYYAGKNKNDPRNGINRFKETFGGVLRTYYNYTKFYSLIYRLAKSVF